jgi:hypothetical protein
MELYHIFNLNKSIGQLVRKHFIISLLFYGAGEDLCIFFIFLFTHFNGPWPSGAFAFCMQKVAGLNPSSCSELIFAFWFAVDRVFQMEEIAVRE